MFTNTVKRIILALFILSIIFNISSCGEVEDVGLYFMTDNSIETLDPQLAKTKAELNYAYACFNRLLSYDKDGKLVKGRQVSEFTESEDGLSFSFTISDGFVWSDEKTPVTAEDYAFGLKRALDSKTNAPYAGLLSALEPSGIKVSGNVISIHLSKKDDNFKDVLAHPICSPCNNTFFLQTGGKYGLKFDDIITNGDFYIYSCDNDSHSLILNRADGLNGDIPSLSFIKFDYSAKGEDVIAAAKEDTYNLYIADNNEFREFAVGSKDTIDFFDKGYCLYTNEKLNVNGINIAKVLKKDIDKSSLNINLPDYCKNMDTIFPSNLIKYNYNNESIKLENYDVASATSILGNDKDTFDFMSELVLYYPDFSAAKTYASMLAQTWQKDLNAYINIKPYDEKNLDKIIFPEKEDEPVLAIVPITSDDCTAKSAVKRLNNYGFTQTNDDSAKSQQDIIDHDVLYPLFEISSRYYKDSKISNINLLPYGGIVDYKYIIKSE